MVRLILWRNNYYGIERDGRLLKEIPLPNTTSQVAHQRFEADLDNLLIQLKQMTEEELDQYEMENLL